MKTYSLSKQTRNWAGRVIAVGLGLSALHCLAATPSNPDDKDSSTPAGDDIQSWEDQFTTRMQHIQREMDDLFRDSMGDLDIADKGFLSGPKFDASATVQDRGDNYVATFDLPKRDLSNVKVNVKDGVLTVNARAEQTVKSDGKNGSANGEEQSEMLDQYEQLVTLPGPVDASKMTVDKRGDAIVVTIPKENKTASAK